MRHANKPKTLTDSVYNLIREDIIRAKLAPETKLKIEALKRQYDVGATPIREALSRLSADGFVLTEGQRGFQTAPISIKDLSDLTELRIMLEQRALQESIQNGDDEWESRLVGSFYQLTKAENSEKRDIELWEKRNRAFHEILISACTSHWLIRFYNILYDQHKRYRNISMKASSAKNVKRDLHAEHKAIYEAAIDRDVEVAKKESEKHIRQTAEITMQVLQADMDKQNKR